MNIGTRSVLYGYHACWLHWFFVARGWYQLHKFRSVKIGVREDPLWPGEMEDVHTSLFDPRLWAAFFLHDLGYWGKPNMDGEEGEQHPFWAWRVMDRLFGAPWGTFCLYHSRFLANKEGEQPSMLCAPDKMAIALYPRWLFILLVTLSGEIKEYMAQHRNRTKTRQQWATEVQDFARKYALKMRNGGQDTITNSAEELNVNRAKAPGV